MRKALHTGFSEVHLFVERNAPRWAVRNFDIEGKLLDGRLFRDVEQFTTGEKWVVDRINVLINLNLILGFVVHGAWLRGFSR